MTFGSMVRGRRCGGRRALLRRLAGLAVLAFAAPGAATEPPPLDAAALDRLLPALRRGGYVFYFRHATTEREAETAPTSAAGKCAGQRNLSPAGRRMAQAMGDGLRRRGIPVGGVWSSPLCRARETARIAFGEAQPLDALTFSMALGGDERRAQGLALRRLLATPPPTGSNVVLVAHAANLDAAIGYWARPEGTGVLIRPDGRGDFQVLGRLPPGVWREAPAD